MSPHAGDIAVIGLACRFPGGASNESKFWNLLHERKSAHSETPPDRYNANAFHQSGSSKLNTLSTRGGHFLEDNVAAFDAPFFNITSQEAKAMDPTARMLLEVAYEAFENAGLPIENLVGSDTSCYVGCFTRDWHEMLMRDAETAPMYAGTGTGFSLLSNRISWFYDLRGPSLTLDTACSSSLVGVHLACQGLRNGESKIAVVSGANLILGPDLALWLSNLHMLSPDGLSKSFSEGANGYGRGEGIATIILKPLSDALRDGDTVRSVIRGTGVNQDGHTTGITLPNSEAQADLIRSTYRLACLDMLQTPYFEAHGTGTAAGDPLEIAAVAKTMSQGRQLGNDLYVGSVKSNIGHLEGAAGLAGLVKCILMLENDIILPNIHFDKPNPRIPFDLWRIRVPTLALPWPSASIRRASVNSFGYGGTNAHVIVDAAESIESSRTHTQVNGIAFQSSHGPLSDGPHYEKHRLFLFSAHDEAAHDRIQKQFKEYLENRQMRLPSPTKADEEEFLDNLSFTLGERRSRLPWKSCVVASSIETLKDAVSKPSLRPIRSSEKPRIAFIFTGQGAQWARMGLQLMEYPVFKNSIEAADSYLRDYIGAEWSVLEELQRHDPESKIQLAKFSQPLCTVLQVALVELFNSWNIIPAGVVGHSSGEIAAAYCFGAITREAAWEISYWRGKLCSDLSIEAPHLKGAMMAAGLSSDAVQTYIDRVTQGKVVVACVNSPSSVTLSGDELGIIELEAFLKADSIFCRKLKVENAYHSHHMEYIAKGYLEKLSNIQSHAPESGRKVKMASSVNQGIADPLDLGATYWVKNMTSPVLFSQAVETLLQDTTQRRRRLRKGESDFDLVIEIGPHAALKGPFRQIYQGLGIQSITYQSALIREEDATKTALETVGALIVHGASPTISKVNLAQNTPRHIVDLPSYPWNHSLTYWSESRVSKGYRFREHGRHDLLGSPANDFNMLAPKWRHFLTPSENPWIRDHAIQGSIIYPGAGTIALVLEAMHQISDKSRSVKNYIFKDVRITKAIVVPDDQHGVECILQMRRQRSGNGGLKTEWWEFSVFSCLEHQKLEENAFGSVTMEYESENTQSRLTGSQIIFESLKSSFHSAKELCTQSIDPKDFYEATTSAGLKYGPLFQGITEISAGKDHCCCTIEIQDTRASMPGKVESPHLIHPTTLDVIFHSMFAALGNGELQLENAAVPVSFDSIIISGSLPSGAKSVFSGFCHTKKDEHDNLIADICMSDASWEEAKVQVTGIKCRKLPKENATSPAVAPFGTLLWKPDIDLIDMDLLWMDVIKRPSTFYKVGDAHLADGKVSDETPLERALECVRNFIDLAVHKDPALSIAQIGSTPRPIVPESISVLSLTDPNAQFQKQGVQAGSIDILILAQCFTEIEDPQLFLQNAKEVLSEGGKLVFLSDSRALPQPWVEVVHGYDLTLLTAPGGLLHEAEVPLLILKNSKTKESSVSEPIYILQSPEPDGQATRIVIQLADNLSNAGSSTEIVTWPPNTDDLKGKSIISLLELTHLFLATLTFEDFKTLKLVATQCSDLLWVSAGEDPAMQAAVGYLRSLRNENPNLGLKYLLLEDIVDASFEKAAKQISKVATTSNTDSEFVAKDGNLCINRWVQEENMAAVIFQEEVGVTRGYMYLGESAKSLKLVHGTAERSKDLWFTIDDGAEQELSDDEVEIEVKAVLLSPEGPTETATAKSYSGFVRKAGKNCSHFKPGERVCVASPGPYRSAIKVPQDICLLIPDVVSFEEATSWPIVYSTAYQALVGIANLRPSVSVLIQDAATAIGQAAIQIGLESGVELFATVRNELQRQLVQSLGISKSRILSEEYTHLAATIGVLTRNKGVDIIINTTATGEVLRQLWSCIASFGVLVDAVISSTEDSALDMAPFKRGATFSVLDMNHILRESPSLMAEIIVDFSKSLRECHYKMAAPFSVYRASEVAEAFDAQSKGDYSNTVITFDADEKIPVSSQAQNQLSLRGDSTYILVGGLGGLGRSLASLLARNGARCLVTISRSGPNSSPQALKLIRELEAHGVLVKAFSCDVSDEPSMTAIIAQCALELPPIRGVIQSAAVLRDAIYENMTFDQWDEAIKPKIQGSWLLHKLMPQNMDFFIMLSSISGVVGNRSQANYAAGNTFQDALAHYRRKLGLPAVSIDLGLMVGIGLIAERGGTTNLQKSEAVGINETEFHALMKAVITGSFAGKPIPTQVICGLPTGGILQAGGLERPFYYSDPRFSTLKYEDVVRGSDSHLGRASEDENSISSQLARASTLDDASSIISVALSGRIAKGLQTTVDNIDVSKPLHSYGVDSLMAVDIRSWVVMNIKSEISLFDLLSGVSILGLAAKIAKLSKLLPQTLD